MEMIEKGQFGNKSRRAGPGWRDAVFVVLCVAILGMIALLLTPGAIASLAGAFRSPAPPNQLVSKCTVTLESGKLWVQSEASGTWTEGSDGMLLSAGNMVRTDAQSKAVLTFFEGSTVTLEPGTEIKIEQLDKTLELGNSIVIQQVLGRTWSLVEKMVDPRSRYEIRTPSALALVRGTSFIVDVDNAGSSYIGVVEGPVTVTALGKEVSLPTGYELRVTNGMNPSSPSLMDPATMLRYPGHSSGGSTGRDVIPILR